LIATDTLKVLLICHNHPSVRPGGAEAYAYELFEAMREQPAIEPIFLAKGGPPMGQSGNVHSGTRVSPVEGRSDEYLIYTDGLDYDWVYGGVMDTDFYTYCVRDFLAAYRPDVVHVQHTQFLGYPLVREVRNTLPNAAIFYTLHEYLPICHNIGQMVRQGSMELCTRESPRRCHECFPAISPQTFFMRKRFIQAHLAAVDRFIAPSRFLRDRYISWGLPADRIEFLDNGRSIDASGVASRESGPRNRFAFFGQLNAFKGIDVLLEAMRIIDSETAADRRNPGSGARASTRRDRAPRLRIHGGNLDMQPADFQERVLGMIEALPSVSYQGRYDHASLTALMSEVDWVVVPSVWWENSPMVIQEAFLHGRPVIASDIGAMAEKVTDGVNGLHFRAGDAASLARVMTRAATTPGLWEQLRPRGTEVPRMDEHVRVLDELYRKVLDERQGRGAGDAH